MHADPERAFGERHGHAGTLVERQAHLAIGWLHGHAQVGEMSLDWILRTLAGVPESGRPVFLKIVYHGPRAMEELAQYDPNLVVGILGGSAGTTYDAFK